MHALEELTAVYCRERPHCRWGETCIAECEPIEQDDSQVVIKLDCQPDELTQGLAYHFYGRWIDHYKYGRQFSAKTFVRSQPHGRRGTIKYLTTICQGHGVGQATAEKLWERFGSDAVRILRSNPDVVVATVNMRHFTMDKAEAAATALEQEQATENVTRELMDLLDGYGFRKNIIKEAIHEWGNAAARLIKKNPYLLRRFRGAGFLLCDRLYCDLGLPVEKLKRQAACLEFALSKDREGHTWFTPEFVEKELRSKISGTSVRLRDAIRLATRAGRIHVRTSSNDRQWIALAKKSDNEQTIARVVHDLLEGPCMWPAVETCGLDLSTHQREQLKSALQAPVCLFTGSPGTGKTFSAARLIAATCEQYGSDNVAVCAPTGKAAVRISESLQAYGVNQTASTIHRLLGVQSSSAKNTGDGWGFAHDETNPLPQKFFFLDEGSMSDVDILAALFLALPRGAHVCIIGDTNQLPPIGHGAPLRDMIAANIPRGELREIQRNTGTIVQACAAVRDAQPIPFDSHDSFNPDVGANLLLKPTSSNAASMEAIVTLLKKLPAQGVDPVWDTQVLVTVNGSSEVSRDAINKRLQMELNPAGERITSVPFRVGDKIIRVRRNTLMPLAEEEGETLVCNGEIGRVIAIQPKLVIAQFTAPDRLIKIPLGATSDQDQDQGQDQGATGSDATNTGCDFDLGYGITVHKSQGSEAKVILYPLDDSRGAMMLGCRELFYTAISRGKFFDVCFGKKQTAEAMCTRRAIAKRKTFLKELITRE